MLYAGDPVIDITLDKFQVAIRMGTFGTQQDFIDAACVAWRLRPLPRDAGSRKQRHRTSGRRHQNTTSSPDVAIVVSATYREGPDVIRTMLDGLRQFMEYHRICSLNELGSRRPQAFTK